MQLFFNSEIDESTDDFRVSKEESRHIVKVLRKKIGDHLDFTNGKGWHFECVITNANDKSCSIRIIEKIFHQKRPFNLHIVVAPTKMNDRYEWFLEKATEIGVETISPIICDHSERKQIKIARMQKIIESAMKQSKRFYLPKLSAPVTYKEFITHPFQGQGFIAHCQDDNLTSLKSILDTTPTSVTILIGPEGDFSVKEIEMALEAGYIPVNLGKSRLRTETAAIVACHTVALGYE